MGFPGGSDGKESACNAGDSRLIPGRETPWIREWLPISVFLPGEFCEQGSLRLNYGGGNEDNGDLLQRSYAYTAHSVPPTLQQAPTNHVSTGDSWTLTGKSG